MIGRTPQLLVDDLLDSDEEGVGAEDDGAAKAHLAGTKDDGSLQAGKSSTSNLLRGWSDNNDLIGGNGAAPLLGGDASVDPPRWLRKTA